MKKLILLLTLITTFSYGQQFARPDGDITTTGVISGTFASIDEVTASDSDFVATDDNTAAVYEISLSDVIDPLTGSGHTLRYRVSKADGGVPNNNSGNDVTLNVELYQGATLIQLIENTLTLGLWTTRSLAFTNTFIDNITDYTDLRLRFTCTNSGGSPSNRRGMAISWVEVEVPDASTPSRRIFITNK